MIVHLTSSAMLFVRSPNAGTSHHPADTAWEQDVAVVLRIIEHGLMIAGAGVYCLAESYYPV